MSPFFTIHNIAIIITRLFAGKLRNMFLMALSSVIVGFGGVIYSQYLQADILLSVSDDRRGVANSTLMLFQDSGTGAGAAVFGVISEHLGYVVTFIGSAIITALSIPVSLIKQKK